MKRLGIFVFYDREGIVDNYIVYLLENLMCCIDTLVVMCNGNLSEAGKECIEQFAHVIYTRENKGYDVMAYKEAMVSYIGWDMLQDYDEVVLLNDSIYGPLFSLEDVFNEMAKKEIDFWGITRQAKTSDFFSYGEKIMPMYIQSYFWVFRKKAIQHKGFQKYWEQLDSTNWIFSDVVNRHEKIFTQKMEEWGFKWDTFVKADEFESVDPKRNYNPYYYVSYPLIKKYRFPFVKRKNFILKHISENPGATGTDLKNVLKYIEEETNYNTNMIWDNLLRLYNINTIKEVLNLNYIINVDYSLNDSELDAAIFISLHSNSGTKFCREYIENASKNVDVYIIANNREIVDTLHLPISNSIHIEVVSELCDLEKVLIYKALQNSKKYKYIAFIHDVDFETEYENSALAYSVFDNLWTNLIGTADYIQQIIKIFEENSRLGILVPPKLFCGTFFEKFVEMSENQSLIDEFGFWCRTDVLNNMLVTTSESELDYRQYPYIAQKEGLYTGMVADAQYMSACYGDMNALLRAILQKSQKKYEFHSFDEYIDGDILQYAQRHSKIMIYGAGENGYRVATLLKKHHILIDGFIVSEGQPNSGEKYGYPILTLSEIEDARSELGIIVSVSNSKFCCEILTNLNSYGYEDIYVV